MKRFTYSLSMVALLCSCTSDTNTDVTQDKPESSCSTGKCDSPGQLEVTPLEAIKLNDVVGCEVTRDTSTTDEFFQTDTIACRFNGVPADGVGMQVVTLEVRDKDGEYIDSESWSGDQLDTPQEHAFLARPSAYPLKVRTRLYWKGKGFGLRGDIDSPSNDLFGGPSHGIERTITRPTDSAEVKLEPSLEFWPIVLWPTRELEEAWIQKERTFWYGTLRGDVAIPRGEGFEQPSNGGPSFSFAYNHSLIARSTNESLTSLPQLTLFIPAIPDEPSAAVMEMQWDGAQEKVGTVLTKPGYYLLEKDGSLTEATPEQVRERGARQTTPPPVVTTPDMDSDLGVLLPDLGGMDMGTDPNDMDTVPDMPPVDPCQGACSEAQVCVAAACVKRNDQIQYPNCNPPQRSCDIGEDSDCAADHACVEGMCRRLSCQIQYPNCNPSTSPCDAGENSDCAADHACVEGTCRRLSCQIQYSNCNPPNSTCDAEEDSDCAADHACVEGSCRRLSCQIQYPNCNPPRQPCSLNTHCAAAHTCSDAGVCERDTCN